MQRQLRQSHGQTVKSRRISSIFIARLFATGVILTGTWGTLPVRADIERFPFTYGWQTPPKGELELEIRHFQPANARYWQDQASLEIGVTDRLLVEPYIVYNRSGGFRDVPATQAAGDSDEGGGSGGGGGSAIFDPVLNGSAYRYGGVLLETRYRFGDYARNRLLTAAYVEYSNLRDSPQGAETKLIGQYDMGRKAIFAYNLIAETPVSRGGKTGWGYSLGATYLADKRDDRYWLGGEAFGSFSDTQSWIGPSAGYAINDKTRLIGTYGKQIQGSGGDRFQIMLSRELN